MIAEGTRGLPTLFAGPGPRIYYCQSNSESGHSGLVGELPRIAAMNFDWLLVGGEHETSVDAEASALAELRAAAERSGIRVMADLNAHSGQSQFAVSQRLARLLKTDVDGIRCRHAHALSPASWRELFADARRNRPVTFLADAVGAPLDDVFALASAGFDLLFNSACWWDFHAPWLLEQYDLFRPFVRTVSFPEPPAGPRLIDGLDRLRPDLVEAVYRSRYLFAASFSAGVLMPMGYEHGSAGPASDRDAASPSLFDLSTFIAEVNRLKSSTPALNAESRLVRLNGPDAGAVALLHLDHELPQEAGNAAILCLNPTERAERISVLSRVVFALDGSIARLTDLTPDAPDASYRPDVDILIEPFGARLLVAERTSRRAQPPAHQVHHHRLRKLAASRIAIEAVSPEIDGGRFPAKASVGDVVEVSADIFCDGHEQIRAALRHRHASERDWHETPMTFVENDRWRASFTAGDIGRYLYTIEAWRDPLLTWRADTDKKHKAGQPVDLEVLEAIEILRKAVAKARGETRRTLQAFIARLAAIEGSTPGRLQLLMSEEAADLVSHARYRVSQTAYDKQLELVVDRSLASFGAWYEMMPRSQSGDPNRHGTFDDVIARLPYVRDLGFDVLYFPPIHPIGRTNRKGRNNSLVAGPKDPGSPYAIGSEEGGHDALHPELGTFDDFARLIEACHAHGLEIALDFAIQCSPDHPWIKEHPEWFDWRPDGTIKFAENPPKKYEDIVNVHFYRDALPGIWYALRDVVLFWVSKGVKIFRVDNPHTKPLPFWEWMIREVQDQNPDVIFLSEAFTRPKMMKRLAKVGFTQSYSYFTWRNRKQELIEYLTELTRTECRHYMRPNFFTNTPDINPYYLQTSGRPGFQVRLVLAATLATSYGIYNGYELCEAAAIPGKEEYLDSEKYEIRAWDWNRAGNIKDDVRLINRIRRENPALWQFTGLTFLSAWNDNILVYFKLTPAKDNCVVIALNLDPHHAHGAHFEVPLWEFGLGDQASVDVVDLVDGRRFTWSGKVQHVWLDPAQRPYAIWRLVPPADRG